MTIQSRIDASFGFQTELIVCRAIAGIRGYPARMDASEKRMAENEALFREVNERVSTLSDRLGPDVPYEYLCECANADCTYRIALSTSEYESVRVDPKQFLVLPMHFTPEVETLVAENDKYWVVRKTGEAGEFVEGLDPRQRQTPTD